MTEQPDATSAAEPAGYAGLEKAALRDLVELSRYCTQTERACREARDERREEAGRILQRRKWRLQARNEKRASRLEEARRQCVAELEQTTESEVAAEQTRQEVELEQTAEQLDSLVAKRRRAIDQAVWLADSVHEGTHRAIEKEHERAMADLAGRAAALDQRHQEAVRQVRAFRQQFEGLGASVEPAAAADDTADLDADWNRHREQVEAGLCDIRRLRLPWLFYGVNPFVAGGVLMLLSAASVYVGLGVQGERGPMTPLIVGGGAVAGLLIVMAIGALLHRMARRRVRTAYEAFRDTLAVAKRNVDRLRDRAQEQRTEKLRNADEKRQREIDRSRNRLEPALEEARRERDRQLEQLAARQAEQRSALDARIQGRLAEATGKIDAELAQARSRYERQLALAQERHDREVADADRAYDEALEQLEKRWQAGRTRIDALIDASEDLVEQLGTGWDEADWRDWRPPRVMQPLIPFGRLRVDVRRQLGDAGENQGDGRFHLTPPPPFDVPALLALPERGSLLIQTGPEGREQGLGVLRSVMARLMTSLPPGKARFTLIDPVGLGQSFAGVMHLADYDDALVGGRVWTEADQIERRLGDLTAHMEDVIQKYLRNEFDTIDAYNERAGELAEPYRFVVLADFPAGLREESARRLAAIIRTGARCGVHTLILRDTREPLPEGMQIEDLEQSSVNLTWAEGGFGWRDEVFGQFPLIPADPPGEELLSRLMHRVGEAVRDASAVELPFEVVTPGEDEVWSLSSEKGLRVPIGQTGASRRQHLALGRGMAQHALLAGKTGSGKSTLLHVLVTNLALWYGPDELEFYLVDFKKGVEFKSYASCQLPHARAVAIESDREFGLSVLQKLDAEMQQRGELCRGAGVQDLAGYRRETGRTMPRILLVIDEFQEFFSEDDRLAQSAALWLDRLVRQGRAFGIHVVLGSQTLGGGPGLPRSTLGQMAVRVALQCSESDSQLILGDDNTAARLLSRPGEAIYNDAGGAVEANSPFQIVWLDDARREQTLAWIRRLADERGVERRKTIVFEGQAPADLATNAELDELLARDAWPEPAAPQAWLGESVTIKEPTHVRFQRRAGSNLLIIGQREEVAEATLAASLVSLAAQHAPGQATFYLFEDPAAELAGAGALAAAAAALPHEVHRVPWSEVTDTFEQLGSELEARQAPAAEAGPAVYVLIQGLHRYRMLRRQEDDFSFSLEQTEPEPRPDRQLTALLREGPAHGMHVLTWCDTTLNLERTFDRTTLREFDHRVLFQMSMADSSSLIDSPAAAQLGLHRAIYFSEERGAVEKFRPYARIEPEWLAGVEQALSGRTNGS
ncbi:MAG: FtsK/SpoIIIE domain-containing protein [Phycisphaeraceae bacterium]